MSLNSKKIVLGISGGIAAYKAADLASRLVKNGADVHVIMTKNALEFIKPLTFETLTGNKCITDTFDRNFEWDVKHISLAKSADVIVVAPATANIIAKLAHGIADDMLTTTVLAASCKKLIAPSMNTGMLDNPITKDNINTLVKYGFNIIEPDSGYLACRDTGRGRLPDTETLLWNINSALTPKDMLGKKVVVTAGATREPLDPVRFISNRSSGKMGYSIAQAACERGAEVTIVSGKTSLPAPKGCNIVEIETAEDMFEKVIELSDKADIIIKAAAVADYRPEKTFDEKMKKSDTDLTLKLSRNRDILKYLGEHKRDGLLLCGFSMETSNLIENSKKKLINKNADMIIANNLKQPGAGFEVDTNIVTIITKSSAEQLPKMSKREIADQILDRLIKI